MQAALYTCRAVYSAPMQVSTVCDQPILPHSDSSSHAFTNSTLSKFTQLVCVRSATDLVDVDIKVQKGLISPYIAFNPLSVAYIKCAPAP